MPQREYFNFDLLIEPASGAYRARVLNSPAGETRSIALEMPFSALEMENLVLRVGQPRRHMVRGANAPEVDVVRRFGGKLFEAVFQGELRTALDISVNHAETVNAGLRVRLRLSESPALADLPWEYLYDPEARRFLALSEWTPVVRYMDLPGRIRPLAVQSPLRVLVMTAGPSDFEPLDTEAEWVKIQSALSQLESAGRARVDRVPTGTLGDLRRQLRRSEYHVFHFIGHGRYDPHTGDGLLALVGPDGRGLPITGADLGALLHDHRSLRLAVLNACEGARGGGTDPYSGTARSLIHQGIPAVVAMQFEITDRAAIIFGQTLYEAIVDNYPLDAAVSAARNAVRDQPNPLEWATPVLYLRAPDGRIFDFAAASSNTDSNSAPVGGAEDGLPPSDELSRTPTDSSTASGSSGPRLSPVEVRDRTDPHPITRRPVPSRSVRLPVVVRGWWKWAAGATIAASLVVMAVVLFSHEPAPDDENRTGDFHLVRVNFQSPDAETPDGYIPDFGEAYGPKGPGSPGEGLTFGWVHEGTTAPVSIISQGRDRNSLDDDQRLDTLVHMEAWDPALRETVAAAWEIAVPTGRYAVSVSVGDQVYNSVNNINVEGVTAINQFIGSTAEEFQENTVAVEVSDGRLTVDSRGGKNTKINYVIVKRLQ